jgi:hypothetical protein
MIEIAKLYEDGEIDLETLFDGEIDELTAKKHPFLRKVLCKVCYFIIKGMVKILKNTHTREGIA